MHGPKRSKQDEKNWRLTLLQKPTEHRKHEVSEVVKKVR